MRERTTWNQEDILKRASTPKTAEDPTAMNQDHIQRQPPADKYLTGDPSTFAEDVHPSAKNWKAEYSDGVTTRNEIGMPEMRDDTFNHPEMDPGSTPARGGGGRQASLDEETLVKKADLCCKVARQILGPKAKEATVEDQALALMAMSDADLIATVNRMAQDDQGQQQQGGQEQKQAKDLPPEFVENMEKKKEEAKDKEAAQGKQAQMPDFIKEKIEEKEEKDEKKDDKEASTRRLATLDQMAQQLQQMAQQVQQMMQQQAQGQQQQAPMAQQQEQQVQMEQQSPGMQEQQALDQMLQQQSNDQMIDQMLQQGQGQPQQMQANNELGVQIDSPSMDIGEVSMTPEDDVLTTLFANNTEVQNAQQAHTLQHGAPAPMQVQASGPMTRTASTRTMGTRPTAGVSTIGGLGSPAPSSSGGDVEKLSSLWNSAPDVSDVFRS